MVEIAAFESVKLTRTEFDLRDGYRRANTKFITPTGADDPQAFLAENSPGRVLGTHFHEVDQFQVVVQGGGVLGKHSLAPGGVHFARAYTPYGPTVAGKDGLSFLTLRRFVAAVGKFLPESRQILDEVPDRHSWQATDIVTSDSIDLGANDVVIRQMDKIKDERGLAASFIKLKAGARVCAPSPSDGEGQFIVVTRGSFTRENKEYRGLTVIYISSDENAMELLAGPEGLDALALNFPKRLVAGATDSATIAAIDKNDSLGSWECGLCSFTYDEKRGAPEYGIAPGTRWADIPTDFACPDCSAPKEDFERSEPCSRQQPSAE